MTALPRPRPDLRRHRVEDQVLVYDALTDRTHLLDPATGSVLELLAEGGRTLEALVSELGRRLDRPADESLLALSIDELRKADLLNDAQPTAPLNEVSRRQLLQRAGLAGAAAVFVPAIVSLSASPAYALSGTLCSPSMSKPNTCGCGANSGVCASGCCKSNGNSSNGKGTCVTPGSGISCA